MRARKCSLNFSSSSPFEAFVLTFEAFEAFVLTLRSLRSPLRPHPSKPSKPSSSPFEAFEAFVITFRSLRSLRPQPSKPFSLQRPPPPPPPPPSPSPPPPLRPFTFEGFECFEAPFAEGSSDAAPYLCASTKPCAAEFLSEVAASSKTSGKLWLRFLCLVRTDTTTLLEKKMCLFFPLFSNGCSRENPEERRLCFFSLRQQCFGGLLLVQRNVLHHNVVASTKKGFRSGFSKHHLGDA